jgi:hypothetical protein
VRKPPETFIGRPCRRAGHTERYADGKCRTCAVERQTALYRVYQKRRGPTKPELAAKARAKARAAGRTFYRGQPCKYGHDGKRYVNTAMCAHPDCVALYRHPPLHTLSREKRAHILKVARDRDRRGRRALAVLKELGLTL